MMITILNMSMFALFGWFISHYAKNTMPRLIWIGLGIYVLVGAVESGSVIYNLTTYFGLGLILPHLVFLYWWIKEVINTTKLLTQDTYYFFLTVYYKIRNQIYWFLDFYNNIRAYFYGKRNRRTYEKFYKDKGYTYEEPKQEKKQEKTYEYKKEGYKQKQESKSEYKQQEEPKKSETKKDYDKYGRFDSKDPYVVLGVSRSDDLKTIKIARRNLQKEFHTDKHHDKSAEVLKKYTEITQSINNAWDEIKKEKK